MILPSANEALCSSSCTGLGENTSLPTTGNIMLSTTHNTLPSQNSATQETITVEPSNTGIPTPETQLAISQNDGIMLALFVVAFIAREVRLTVQAICNQ
ncbi:MAG: hypothetical protein AAGN15_24030 [Cyanobacteria bacterium J06581_3]